MCKLRESALGADSLCFYGIRPQTKDDGPQTLLLNCKLFQHTQLCSGANLIMKDRNHKSTK